MTLKQTLRTLIDHAKRANEPARVRLAKGLGIAIRMEGEVARVQLSRVKVAPSLLEWRTVIQQWPGQCQVMVEPTAREVNGTHYLIGRVKIVPELVPDGIPGH